ncbi:MAG: CBS domain-containing protein [Planctomycetes bacterium]|nr:CBS domain-containing protein [Planctomycetota bacterium]
MKAPACAKDVMSRPVRTLVEDATIRDAAAFLLRHRISGAPVMDRHGQPVGVFTLRDMAVRVQNRILERPVIELQKKRGNRTRESVFAAKSFHVEGFDKATVAEFMSPRVVWVAPTASLRSVVRTMAALKIHHVFVMKDGRIIGVITSLDIIRWLEKRMAAAARGGCFR